MEEEDVARQCKAKLVWYEGWCGVQQQEHNRCEKSAVVGEVVRAVAGSKATQRATQMRAAHAMAGKAAVQFSSCG